MVKNLPASAREAGLIPGSGRCPGEGKEIATHFSILAWEIPWTEDPGGYSPWDHKRVGHDLVTKQQQQHKIHIIYIHYFVY